MKKKFTAKSALRFARKHWLWLAENPLSPKDAYPPIKEMWATSRRALDNDCSLCEYDEHAKAKGKNKSCTACPMLDKWPMVEGGLNRHCNHNVLDLHVTKDNSSTYYAMWVDATAKKQPKTASMWARKMAETMDAELKRLKKEG